ncbi:N-acetylmuramoyl-L-alanine amidase [Synechococcus sp. PCC 7502]|uniref:N-acetylmuramoyl-L-alanine amidase n=1 Tax=Synechococcus sp. PCC 7502 TaxID=1173263 RepID=UPI00029F8B1E|nr:N-acetylmuramoyl-L-alanine amidase [Synechococcus sp. PCC 7502]AFY74638.1 N-acetylmuramoyl-L-alanine amidase [Synechococcus sp. PCC 7502]
MLRYRHSSLSISLSLCILLTGYGEKAVAQSQDDRVLYAQATGLQLRGVQNTPEGIVLLINGNPKILSQRAINPDRLVIDLVGTVVPPNLHKAVIPINRYGVRQVRIGQNQQNPPTARIVLDFESQSETSTVDWEAIFTPNRGAVIIRPTNAIANNPPPRPSLFNPPPSNSGLNANNNSDNLTLIQKLNLTQSGQLLIQTNQPFTYLGTEDVPSGTYNITINNAKISPQLVRPSLDGTALDAIRMTQVGSSVVIGLRPSVGWRIREDARSDPQQIYVQLYQPQNSNANASINRANPNISQNPPIPSYLDPNLPITDPPANPPRTSPPTPRVIPAPNVANRGKGVIVLDPGHGGNDVGAVGNGIYEANVVLAIALKLGRILQEMGYTVIYTRTDNTEVELQPRVDIAERVNADTFVSIHANSLEARQSQISGIETYYAPGATLSGRLANFVHNQIINTTGASDRGVRTARFHVIRRTSMPSILVETGFVTNPQESANLNNPSYQERMAGAIARGVDQFLKSR